jgi:hypothetical protein
MDRIESLERFAHGQAHWIDDLRGQMSELHGEPIPPSVLLSPSLGSEEEVADDEAEAEEEVEVSTLVGAPPFQEVEGSEYTTPLEENEDLLPVRKMDFPPSFFRPFFFNFRTLTFSLTTCPSFLPPLMT